jgi:hypothetical protein
VVKQEINIESAVSLIALLEISSIKQKKKKVGKTLND